MAEPYGFASIIKGMEKMGLTDVPSRATSEHIAERELYKIKNVGALHGYGDLRGHEVKLSVLESFSDSQPDVVTSTPPFFYSGGLEFT
jgi:hypothetical protein